MSQIHDVLQEMQQLPGVRGAMVVARDGMVVAGSLSDRFREDVVSALTSFLLTTTQRALDDGSLGNLREFVLHCTHGKILLTEIGEPFLVVLLDQFAELSSCRREIADSVRQLGRLTQIG